MEAKEVYKEKSASGVWLKRLGVAGFTFFLVKGLFWLAIFFGIGEML